MTNKMIIENRSNVDDKTAFELALTVINQGRISNEGRQYCYLTTFTVDGREVWVSTDINKKSDRFVIFERDKGE